MKHWQETRQLFSRAVELLAVEEGCAIGTVVAIAGSAYRRPGAKLLIAPDGRSWGGVSGGCLEEDVREVAMGVIASGEPVLRRYETGSEEDVVWGLGLGCDGSVEIFVQPLSRLEPATGELLRAALARFEGRTPFAVATYLDGPDRPAGTSFLVDHGGTGAAASATPEDLASVARRALAEGASCLETLPGARVFVDAFLPPSEVLLCGAGDDAVPLAAAAAQAGFRVTVADHRPAYLTPERFPRADLADPESLPEDRVRGAYGVVMTHNLESDRRWVAALVERGAAYVGLLGPRSRRDDILSGIDERARDRVYGPVGLDIGADGPEQVALSIVAEMLAVHAGREPRHLRDRGRPIHERQPELVEALPEGKAP